MPQQAISPSKKPEIQETSLDKLFHEAHEWWHRIAKRAYDSFAASGFTNGHDLDDWFKAEKELLKPITLDIKDNKDEFIVKAEVPGFEANELDIHVNGSHLVIEGKHESSEEKKEKEGKTLYSERRTQQIYRMVELPASIDSDKVDAELKNGVLELKLPKAEKSKQIKVSAA